MGARRRPVVAAVAAVLALAGGRLEAGDAPMPPPRPAPTQDSRTDVVAHPDASIVPGRNVLWCATSQLAWDALADAVGKDGRLPLGGPAPAALVERMNRRGFPHDAIDRSASVVVAGRAADGVEPRLRDAWRTAFGDAVPVPELALGTLDAGAVAAFAKDLPFTTPFEVHPHAMSFDGGTADVRAWGMRDSSHGPGAEAMAKQVVTFVAKDAIPGAWRSGPVIVELRPSDVDERVVLAEIEPRATLEATWDLVDETMRASVEDSVDSGSLLVVPTVRAVADARFTAFEGAPIVGMPGSSLRAFRQRVQLDLTERGASVRAAAAFVATAGIHPDLVFDRPFLVALRRAKAAKPYLLAWVGNDSWLERVRVESLDAAAIRPYVGAWELDVERTIDASIRRYVSLGLVRPAELGFPEDAHPTTEQLVARAKAKRAESGERRPTGYTLDVDADGTARLRTKDGATHHRLRLERYDGRVVFLRPPAPDDVDAPRDERFDATLRDGALELDFGDVFVFRRP
jgi:hypothetical protein